VWPSPVVALNRTIPLAEVAGPTAALAEVEALVSSGQLNDYPYLPAVQANLLLRLGRRSDAEHAYRRALDLSDNDAERAFLAEQLASLE
jgi:RNA polymerase sigma-70 factor, ECF subfamily